MIPKAEALRLADRIIFDLSPCFQGFDPGGELPSLEIAGSLRRGSKAEYDEIDLIGIPDLSHPPRARPEFGKPVPKQYETKLDQYIDELREKGEIVLTDSGPRQKKFVYCEGEIRGVKVDLYLVRPPATWGVQTVIRTGPEEFSHWIVTRRKKGGALPDGYRVQGGAVYEGEEKVPEKKLLEFESIGFETEDSFLNFLGLGWIYPEDREARWGLFGGRSNGRV